MRITSMPPVQSPVGHSVESTPVDGSSSQRGSRQAVGSSRTTSTASSQMPEQPFDLRRALAGTTALNRLEQIHKHHGFLSSALHCFTKPPAIPLNGPGFGRFMANVVADVAVVARGMQIPKSVAAETMRQAVVDGEFGGRARPENKARMILALYSIREMEEAKGELQSVMSEHAIFKNVNIDNIWRMLLDGKAHDDGKHQGLRFDNEPGYLAGMYRGLTQVLRNDLQRDNRVAPEMMLAQLHDKAVGGVADRESVKSLTDVLKTSDESHTRSLLASLGRETSRNNGLESDDIYNNVLNFMVKDYRSRSVGFDLIKNLNLTEEGFNELKQRYMGNEPLPFMLVSTTTAEEVYSQTQFDEISRIALSSLPLEQLPEELHPAAYVQTQLNHYRQNIGQISDEKGKLTEIARLCQALEQAHCFTDGNARTLGFLFVNQLLLENNLSPSVIYDPNRFDGFSHQELVAEIQKGQRLFERL